jgi:hypothetical protein
MNSNFYVSIIIQIVPTQSLKHYSGVVRSSHVISHVILEFAPETSEAVLSPPSGIDVMNMVFAHCRCILSHCPSRPRPRMEQWGHCRLTLPLKGSCMVLYVVAI